MWEAKMNAKQVLYCGLCQGDHHTDQCHLTIELVNFMGNFGRQKNFNQGWKGSNQWNNKNGAQWGQKGQPISASTQVPLGFDQNFGK